MWRALVFLGLLAIAAYGAVWLANNPETVALTWQGREYSTTLAIGVVGFLATAIALAVLFSLLQFLLRLPSRMARRGRERRQAKGFRALSRGIVAVSSGDVASARRHATQADKLLGREPLTLLLQAQTAQASGDRDAAERAFRNMTEEPDTRLLGLRGLYMEARRRGDAAEAASLAAEAARIAPAVGWASEAVLEGHTAGGDWRGATQMIERRTSLGLVDRATSRRQRAVLGTADALAREGGDPEGALAGALDALRLAPDLVPAAALAGRLLSRRGDYRRAAKVLETAWAANPHPELAAAYLNVRPGDSAMDRLGRAETLAKLSSWSTEARLAIARAAAEAREFGKARDALAPLLADMPTARACLTMAEIERLEGNAGAAREWLARAARAPRDKAWIADGVVSDSWAPVSPVTGRLDAFVWDVPPERLGGPDEDFARLAEALPAEPAVLSRPEPAPETAEVPPAPEINAAAPSTRADPVPEPEAPAAAERRFKLLAEAMPSKFSGPEAAGTAEPEPSPAPVAAVAESAAPALVAPAPSRPVAPEPSVPVGADRSFKLSAAAMPQRFERDEVATAQTGPAPPVEAAAASPVEPAPPRRLGVNGAALRTVRDPEPVVFPVPHAPDDPGLESGEARSSRAKVRR